MSRQLYNAPAVARWGPAAALGLVLVALNAPAARAATLVGTVRDAVTMSPLAGVDLDVFDATFRAVNVTALTAADGTYQMFLPSSGAYYVRCDPSVAQPHVGQYYPGVFLKSQALTLNVPPIGTATANFNLSRGGTISGHVLDLGTDAPLAGVDLDVFHAPTEEFIGTINTTTDVAGAYTLGAFPIGSYLLRAQPAPSLFHQALYYNNKPARVTANPIVVTSLGNIPNVVFRLPVAGSITGTVYRADQPASVLGSIDIDLYDSAWRFIAEIDAATDPQTGVYVLGSIPPGQYFVRADPAVSDRYVTTYWPNSYVQGPPAQLISVQANAATTADFTLAPGGTIAGRITDATTGAAIANATVVVFQAAATNIVFGAGASSDAGGDYEAGVLLPGSYKVRVQPPPGSDRAFKFWDDHTLWSLAPPVTVTVGQRTGNIHFQLAAGGTITGTVRHAGTPVAVVGADLDVFAANDEFIGALDAITDGAGNYAIHGVPPGIYKVKTADPSAPQSTIQYWNHSPTKAGASPVSIVALGTASGIDFDVQTLADAGGSGRAPVISSGMPRPNPFTHTTRLEFSLGREATVEAAVYDIAGRRVRALGSPALQAAGEHAIRWDGKDSGGRRVASGIYWLRIRVEAQVTTHKVVRIRPRLRRRRRENAGRRSVHPANPER